MTMTSYVIYGVTDQSVDELIPVIEAALGIKFVAHESLYRGLYYLSGRLTQENCLLQSNYLTHRNEMVDAKYPDYPVILYVNKTQQPDEMDRLLREAIPSIQQLHRGDYKDD